MRFGWLTLAHSPSPDEDGAAIDAQMAQACHAEAMGFDGIWLTEHNFTGESVYCDPIPFAAALAMRTSRIRIGFAVIQMALRHPIRLATQLALLDNLSKGRLDVGVGRGSIFNEYEYVGYGLRSADARERMAESLDILTRVWTESPFRHKGTYYDLALPELRPRPVQRPHPPLWLSTVSPDSFTAAGRRGLPIVTVRLPNAQIADRWGRYRTGLEDAGLDRAARDARVAQAALWRHVYVADSQAEAEDEFSAALLHTRQHMTHARDSLDPADFRIDPAMLNAWTDPAVSDADGVAFALANGAIYGTPRRVREEVAALSDLGVGHVLAQMSFGYLPHEKIMRSMRLFGEQVIPALR